MRVLFIYLILFVVLTQASLASCITDSMGNVMCNDGSYYQRDTMGNYNSSDGTHYQRDVMDNYHGSDGSFYQRDALGNYNQVW